MKFSVSLVILFLIYGCFQNDSAKSESQVHAERHDSLGNDTVNSKDSEFVRKNAGGQSKDTGLLKVSLLTDSVSKKLLEKKLIDLSVKILKCIKGKNYSCLSRFVHPQSGIRFSPYAYVDTGADQKFSIDQLMKAAGNQRIIQWGRHDGSGEPIKLSIDDYFRRYVYDVDFIKAENKVANKFLGGGNSLNNLKEVYPKSNFTEFHFSGFDPKYDGMDWRSLRFVFENYKDEPYLIAIIHDQWTI